MADGGGELEEAKSDGREAAAEKVALLSPVDGPVGEMVAVGVLADVVSGDIRAHFDRIAPRGIEPEWCALLVEVDGVGEQEGGEEGEEKA